MVTAPRPPFGVIALVLLGPLLLFPELLTMPARSALVPVLSALALVAGVALVRPWSVPFWGVTLLAVAICVSWQLAPSPPRPSLRHLSGLGLGVLTMGVICRHMASRRNLKILGLLFAVSTVVVCVAGLIGAYITRTKLMLDATQPLSTAMYPWLPHWQLGLPGLEASSGWVNPNALGGTALMLLPVCLGVAYAGRLDKRAHCWLAVAGLVSALSCAAALAMTHSRTALLAGALTCLVAAAVWKPGRRWLLVGILLALVVGGERLWQSSQLAPQNFSVGVELARANIGARIEIWQAGLSLLATRPLAGVGINQFHEITSRQTGEAVYVAHAHNVFLQVALDAGVPGLLGYVVLLVALLRLALGTAHRGGFRGALAAGAGLSLVAVHLWGLGDAVALGAKVGLFQWISAGVILASSVPDEVETRPAIGLPLT